MELRLDFWNIRRRTGIYPRKPPVKSQPLIDRLRSMLEMRRRRIARRRAQTPLQIAMRGLKAIRAAALRQYVIPIRLRRERRALSDTLQRLFKRDRTILRRGTSHQKLSRILALTQQFGALGIIAYVVSSEYSGASGSPNALIDALSWVPVVVRGLLVGIAVAVIYLAITANAALRRAWIKPHQGRDLALHYAFWTALFWGATLVPKIIEVRSDSISFELGYYLIAPVLWIGYIVFGLKVVLSGWRSIPGEQARKASAIWTAVIVASAGWRFFERWQFPNASRVTDVAIRIASWFSNLAGNPIRPIGTNENGWPIYRTGDLSVVVAPTCAGLEGVFLTTLMLLALVAIERKSLHIERALALIVAAAGLTFLGNALRLAALFYIGDHWSAEVAVTGFHTNFGIVSLVIITSLFTVSIRWLAGREAEFNLFERVSTLRSQDHIDVRLAMPEVVAIGASLAVGLFSGEFNWLYPLPAILTAGTLWRMGLPQWPRKWSLTARPLIWGTATFLLWIFLVPPDLVKSGAFAASLLGVPAAWAGSWLLVRLVGSAIIVPVTEELAFRAFLLPWVSSLLGGRIRTKQRGRIALAVSSMIFGFMHADIIAGAVAGFIFGILYQKKNSVFDSIVAHSLTNFLLFGYAMWFEYWSYL